MNSLYRQFLSYLDKDDRYSCVELVLSKLSNNEVDIVTLYVEILAPSLRESFCQDKQRQICIWEEHVRTSIVRTVIECCYPYVIRERVEKYASTLKGKVIVACPTEELHEIGARMVADFFTLCGFDSIFIGANTPQSDILEAIEYVKPRYLAISVSNHYNLLAAHRMVQKIHEVRENTRAKFEIIVGGSAFEQNLEMGRQIGSDLLLATFDDIHRLTQGD
ncbi:MAG: cobalamin B12-binding domain-containing protein [Dehalococcoidia bacterium]|nr:cobalamin B12-binding domain-containing protein [Dehalococcoidia bacterium]